MSTLFNEQKMTEAATHLLRLRGGSMHYLKLVKLLYIADREALRRWGIPISHDRYVSMAHGPVLSRTLDLIKDGASQSWSESISAPFGEHEVKLIGDPAEAQKLSPAEEKLLDKVYEDYGFQSRWDLVKHTHTFPEWTNPNGSSTPINLADILRAIGESEDEINRICAELEYADSEHEALGIQ